MLPNLSANVLTVAYPHHQNPTPLHQQQSGQAQAPKPLDLFVSTVLGEERDLDSPGRPNANTEMALFPGQATVKAVIDRFKAQQATISADDIDDILISNFPQQDHHLAALLLEKMTRFARMESLNGLQAALIQHAQNTGSRIFYEKAGTLGEHLHYLHLKHKNYKGLQSPFIKQSAANQRKLETLDKGYLLLDAVTKAHLSQSASLRQHIAQRQIALLYPPGWDEGINPFNQVSVEATAVKLGQLLKAAKQLQETKGLTPEDSAEEALTLPTRAFLEQWGLGQQLNIFNPFWGTFNPAPSQSATAGSRFPGSKQIAKQLEPAKLDPAQLEQLLDNFQSSGHRQAALELLNQQSEIFSPLRLSLSAQALHLKIMDYAKAKGIQPNQIYYLIPHKHKSFGLVTANHLIANDIPLTQMIEDTAAIQHPEQSLIVILDDVAGSGHSLLDAESTVRKHFTGPLLLAPLVCASTAKRYLEEWSGPQTALMPQSEIPDLEEHPAYQQLDKSHQEMLSSIVGSLGFSDNGLSVVFPYMSPDNNNSFFGKVIAPYFTLNHAGCKGLKYHYPGSPEPEINKFMNTGIFFSEYEDLANPLEDDMEMDAYDSSDSESREEDGPPLYTASNGGGLVRSPAQIWGHADDPSGGALAIYNDFCDDEEAMGMGYPWHHLHNFPHGDH